MRSCNSNFGVTLRQRTHAKIDIMQPVAKHMEANKILA